MKFQHILLAILVTAVWGFNFVAIKTGLQEMPPFLYACSRFVISSLPLLWFIKKPDISWTLIISIGVTLGIIKFGLLFWGIHLGMSAGLASLLSQSQAFFTTLLAVLILKDRIYSHQIVGMVIAFSGIGLIGTTLYEGSTLLGFILVIGGALSWAVYNILLKKAGNVNMFALTVWTGIIPPHPYVPLLSCY